MGVSTKTRRLVKMPSSRHRQAPLMVPEFRNQFSLKRVVSQVFVLSQPLYRQASILVEGFSIYDDVDLAVPWLMRVANKTRRL